MNALDPSVAEFLFLLKQAPTEKRRRLNAMIDGATADDPSAFFENPFELGPPSFACADRDCGPLRGERLDRGVGFVLEPIENPNVFVILVFGSLISLRRSFTWLTQVPRNGAPALARYPIRFG